MGFTEAKSGMNTPAIDWHTAKNAVFDFINSHAQLDKYAPGYRTGIERYYPAKYFPTNQIGWYAAGFEALAKNKRYHHLFVSGNSADSVIDLGDQPSEYVAQMWEPDPEA
ncbi:hypothetical protein HY357_03075 [Candidatus Roizmanbacteria bacterium]|nr:hypothetical protein [Candidatus Roizmanbacteria bacterium]